VGRNQSPTRVQLWFDLRKSAQYLLEEILSPSDGTRQLLF
jgi:hypothetical protein